jgi:gamma-glutamyltranspeptidase/glutathione hydrolase
LYQGGVVVTASPIATDIGLEILRRGGNAFDAAVAIGFALAVTYPQAGNIGGGGFALLYRADSGEIRSLDFRETAPAASRSDMYLDDNSEVIKRMSLLGAGATGVPGTVAGMYEIWKSFGSLSWYELLAPAINLADTGFIVDEYLAGQFSGYENELRIFDETESQFFRSGNIINSGDRLIQKELSQTLERITIDTLKGFYEGQTAGLIVETMEKYGGYITLDDLSNYRAVWREPLYFDFDSLQIYSMAPPSSGGLMMGMILGLIEPYDFALLNPQSPDYIHIFTEACRLAYAERAVHLGDPDYVENPVEELLHPAYLDSRRELIDLDHAGMSSDIGSGIAEISTESESTTHYSIVDEEGNAISLSYTINTAFGSKLVVGGAGFLLNNEMDDFSIKPGWANVYGLVGGKANEIAPGKRMLSSMSPTIVLKKGKPCLVLGTPGGSKIITAIAQAIIDYARFDLSASDIVKHPRFHHQWLPDTLFLEIGGFDINIKQDLISKGHNIKERYPYCEIEMIYIDDSGMKTGTADPRGGGKVAGY